MDQNERPLEPHHLGVPYVLSKMIPEPVVRLAQIVHLSCSNTNTVSKWTETRFDMTHVIWEFHQACPNDLWAYVHSAQTVHQSCVKISTSSPRSTIGCIENDFSVWHKMCTCLALTLTPYPNGLKQDLTWPTSHTSSIGCVQNNSEPMVHSAQTVHPSRIKISTISKWIETNFHLSLVI
jgi:hypothetical protein